MVLKLAATYENGVLKVAQPLPLAEHETVEIVVLSKRSIAEETAGSLKGTCDLEELDRLACDPDFSLLEAP